MKGAGYTAHGEFIMNGLIAAEGSFHRLRLPVLTLGSSDAADVLLAGASPIHCLVAVTPAGPALRAFDAESTRVNGQATAAALLKHGDVLEILGTTFTLAWHPLEAEPAPDNTALDREREEFEAEKLAAQTRLAAIRSQHEELKGLQARTRTAAAAYLKKQRRALQQQQHDADEALMSMVSQRQQLQDSERRLALEHAQFRGETEAADARLAVAWSAIYAAQAQLTADRASAEAEIASHAAVLDARKAELDRVEAGLDAHTAAAVERLAALQSEVAGLEPRAAQARMVLADLNKQQAEKATRSPAPIAVHDWSVPLDARHDSRSADQLIQQLRQQEHEVGSERQRLAAQMHHAATEREQLADQRILVAEQIRSLETTRRQWKEAQTQTLGELEQLTRTLAQREADLNARSARVSQAEDARRTQSEQLADSRRKLEAWQATLAARESKLVAERQAEVPLVLSYRTEEFVELQRAA